MIAFRDFAPGLTPATKWYDGETRESFEAAVAAANAWIAAEGVTVTNVETVVLPNIYASGEEGTGDGDLAVGAVLSSFHQFLRVWYLA